MTVPIYDSIKFHKILLQFILIIECYPTSDVWCEIVDCLKPGAVELCPNECYQGNIILRPKSQGKDLI